MKVNIDKTIEVSDEQRKAIAAQIDDVGSKKRDATRDEMKQFIWNHGENWDLALQSDAVDEPEDDDPMSLI